MLTFPLILGIFFSVYGWKADLAIAARQKTATATIDAHNPPNHDRYEYVFEIGGQSYTGWQSPTGDQHFFIGQRLTVYYDPLDPTENSLTDFQDAGLQSLGPVPMMLLLICAAGFTIVMLRRHFKGNATSTVQ